MEFSIKREKRLIQVKNLSQTYGEKTALDTVSFEIKTGEIVGLLGLNGAGKSTTMNILTGYLSPSSGSVYVNGFDMGKEPGKAKRHIGYLPEHYAQAWADKGDLRVLLPATFGYQAPFSMIMRRGRSREPLIQTFRDLLKTQLNQA